MEEDRNRLTRVLLASSWHADALRHVRDVCGEAGWIGAGFVRNAVWDDLNGWEPKQPEDVDVLIHDQAGGADREKAYQAALCAAAPDVPWSVRNQARMHVKHGDAPYSDIAAAMRQWPETATAVAVRLDGDSGLWILAPFGLSDLTRGILRPAQDSERCRSAFASRMAQKAWRRRWPDLTVEDAGPTDLFETGR